MSTAEGEGGRERFFLYRLPNKCFFFHFFFPLTANRQLSLRVSGMISRVKVR